MQGFTPQELLEGGYGVQAVVECGYSLQALESANIFVNYKMHHPHCEGVMGVYCGQQRGFRAEGEGRCQYDNGDVYDGIWSDDRRNGEGRETKVSASCNISIDIF